MMNKLMKHLQQWADEGRYDWENGTFKWEGIYINNPPLAGWEVFVQLVLDGTIQVWRPVEHYQPPENAEVLALFLISENAGYELGIVETNVEKDFTHWQPLPQLIQKEKETK